jgi:exonuclease SbcD
MRFLHTADWHIGKALRGRSRIDEHERALAEVLEIAKRESIDALLMAGDVFDTQTPNAEAERLVYQFFAELAAHRIPAIIIAGNHDHPLRFRALEPLLDRMSIHIRPHVRPPHEGGIFEFRVKKDLARIALLPWVPEHKLLDAQLLMGAQADRSARYADRMAEMLKMLTEHFAADSVNIILGHAFVMGAEACGSERAIHLAKPYAMTAQDLPATASYIALGHLHCPQTIDAPSPTRYCGSLLQLDFGEQGQEKEVVIIDAAPRKTASIESIRLTAGRQLRDVSGTLPEIERRVEELNNGDYLRVTVKLPKFKPGIADIIHQLLPNAVDVKTETPVAERGPEPEPLPHDPATLFRHFYRGRVGEPADELMSAFEKLYSEVADAPN